MYNLLFLFSLKSSVSLLIRIGLLLGDMQRKNKTSSGESSLITKNCVAYVSLNM